MSELETAKYILAYMINDILPILEKAIEIIPKDKLDFTPNKKLNSIAWLSYHSLNAPYYYLKGVEQTVLTEKIYHTFEIDVKEVTDPKRLLNYSSELKSFIKELHNKLTEEDVTKKVTFKVWKPWWSQTGLEAIRTSLEEMIHHRGQLCTYLRLLELDPPLLYTYL